VLNEIRGQKNVCQPCQRKIVLLLVTYFWADAEMASMS